MSLDDEGRAGLRREWIATAATALKASTAPASTLPASEKRLAIRGAKLTATLIAEDRAYWTIADGLLDGVPVPDSIRLVFKGHWQLLPPPAAEEARPEDEQTPAGITTEHPPEHDSAAAVPGDDASIEASPPAMSPAPVAAPVPPAPPARPAASMGRPETTLPRPKDGPKVPSHRRIFAAFKRRLTRT